MSIHPEVARIFQHSVLRAVSALVRRCNENIVTSRCGSDVTLDVGRLCSVCHHLPESIARFDEELAQRIQGIEALTFLRDISNTAKHGVLRNPDRQVNLITVMSYACLVRPPADTPCGFAFAGTQVLASSARFHEINVLDLVHSFATGCAAEMGLPEPPPMARPSSIFVGEVIMRTAVETISFEDFELRFFRVEEGAPGPSRPAFNPGPYTIQLLNMANIPLGKIDLAEDGGPLAAKTYPERRSDPDESYRQVTSAPSDEDRKRCDSFAYVSEKALTGKEIVIVRCNCGAGAPYQTKSGSNVCACPACGSTIGINGISGGPGAVPFRRADGSSGQVPIQGFDTE